MKHTACGGWIGIRTDPKSSEYVVLEGARRRDTGSDVVVADRSGALLIGDEAEKERRRQDAFAAFEVGIEDRQAAVAQRDRVEELWMAKERDWKDPGDVNARLRKEFRVGRKMREEMAERGSALQDRLSFGYDLLEEKEEDRRRAGLIEFGSDGGGLDGKGAMSRPLFARRSQESETAKSRPDVKAKDLSKVLVANTKAVLDPFASTFSSKTGANDTHLLVPKRKHNAVLEQQPTPPRTPHKDDQMVIPQEQHVSVAVDMGTRAPIASLLVDYDSD
jgi:coiled-coil domain-containing protein 130